MDKLKSMISKKTIKGTSDKDAPLVQTWQQKRNDGKQRAITPYDEMWEGMEFKNDGKTFTISRQQLIEINYLVGSLLKEIKDTLKNSPKYDILFQDLDGIRKNISDLLLSITKKEVPSVPIAEESGEIKLMEFVPVRFKERDKVIAMIPFSTRQETFDGSVESVRGDKYFVKPDAQALNKLDYAIKGRVKDGLWLSGNELKKKSTLTQQDVEKTAASMMKEGKK